MSMLFSQPCDLEGEKRREGGKKKFHCNDERVPIPATFVAGRKFLRDPIFPQEGERRSMAIEGYPLCERRKQETRAELMDCFVARKRGKRESV